MTQHRKLLVIDDDPAIFRYLRRRLTREGYDVEAAPGQGMLARMDEWQPDVVLLDLTLTYAVSQISRDQSEVTSAIDRLGAGREHPSDN